MGCCSSKNIENTPVKPVQNFPYERLLGFVISDSSKLDFKNDIDDPVIIIDKITLNALGYSLVRGQTTTFIYLLKTMNASIQKMELMLEHQGLNGLDIIIEKGYVELLHYYFPLFRAAFPQKFNCFEDSETSCSFPNSRILRKTPLHVALEKDFFDIVKFLAVAFKDSHAPEKYNIHQINEYTGENSALIACKRCSLRMIKFLRETCSADFKIKNKRNESALHLAAFGSKTNKTEGFEVIKYLVEEIKVDVSFQYEEILLILNDSEILEYIEQQLLKIGILCTKDEVEKKYSISSCKKAKPVFLFEDDSQLTLGAISSIDANVTLGLLNGSIFQDSDYYWS